MQNLVLDERFGPKGNNPPSESEILAEKLKIREAELRQMFSSGKAPLVIADEIEAGNITARIKSIKALISKVGDAHKEIKGPYLECSRIVDAWKNKLEIEFQEIVNSYAKPLTAYLKAREKAERERQLEEARIAREEAERLVLEAAAHEKEGLKETADELINAAAGAEIMADNILTHAHTATPSQLARARSTTGAMASQRLVWVGEITNIAALDLNALRSHFTIEAIQTAVNKFVREGGRELAGVKIEQKSQLSVR